MPPPRVQVAGVTLASMMHDMAAAQGDVVCCRASSRLLTVPPRRAFSLGASETRLSNAFKMITNPLKLPSPQYVRQRNADAL